MKKYTVKATACIFGDMVGENKKEIKNNLWKKLKEIEDKFNLHFDMEELKIVEQKG